MKSYHLILVLLIFSTSASIMTNTTTFWANTLGANPLHYQCYSGYEQIDQYYPKGSTGMFYQLFGAMGHTINPNDPVVPLLIWLQGGPGASSQFGAHTEIGPIKFVKGEAKNASDPWNLFGHLLFIDQPLNVGFSYGPGDRKGGQQVQSANQAGKHLLNFLNNFYNTWPSLKASPLYITGESFGGHYVPAFAFEIIENNKLLKKGGINLVGISIGDGWVDPMNQVNFYDSYLWSVGIVESGFRDVLTWYQTNSILNMYDRNYSKATQYFDFITNNDTTPQVYFGNISMFNFRNYDGIDQSFTDFLNSHRNQLGAKVQFIPGNQAIYTAFATDISVSYKYELIVALKNIKVLIYNGQQDVVVNTAGVLQYINSLNWDGSLDWKRSSKQIWTIYGEVTGWAKVSGNLWFVLVNKAGHMVPSDQPVSAFSMMGHFLHGQTNWKT